MGKSNQRSGWRKSKTRAVAPTSTEFGSRGREGRKLIFLVSMLTTFAVALAIVLFLVLLRTPDRDVPLIVSVVSRSGARSNNDALFTAPNSFASEDADLLRAWFQGGPNDPSANVRLAGNFAESKGVMDYETSMLIKSITKPLSSVQPGGPDGNMIAIYLSAHGFVDRGTPYLAVGDSRADREDTWVRFKDLYDEILGTLKARDDSNSAIRTVLFIDAARIGPQWDWGQFSESFASECAKLTSGESDRIAIILSASPGQRSWWDPRNGFGLFPKAIVESMTGKGDLDSDGTVTVGEIADYLRTQVRQTASATWDAKQTPMMIGNEASDWSFISQPVPVTPPAIDPVDVQDLRDQFASVGELWTRHNLLASKTHPPLAFNPLGWSTLEKKLSRLDACLMAGNGYRDEFKTLRTSCESDLARFENGPDSFPSSDTLPELALRDYFHDAPESTATFDEMVAAWRKKPDVAAAIQVPMDEGQATRFLWDWLHDTDFAPQSRTLSADLMERANFATGSKSASTLEGHFSRMWSAPDLAHLEPGTFQAMADSHLQSRKTLCTDDLRASFWIRRRLNDLESDRMKCIDQMHSRDPDQRSEGRDRWNRTVRPAEIALSETATRISRAYKLRDEMLHKIPRIAETLMTDLQAFENQEQFRDSQSRTVLERAIGTLAELSQSLQLPRDDDNRSIEFLETTVFDASENATDAFNALNKRIIDRLNESTAEKAGDAKGLRQNLALLIGSGTGNADLRQRVHTRLCDLINDKTAGVGTVLSGGAISEDDESSAQSLQMMAINGQQIWDYWLASTNNSDPIQTESSDVSATAQEAKSEELALAETFHKSGSRFRALVANLALGKLTDNLHVDQIMQDPVDQSEKGASLSSTRRLIEKWDTQLRSRTILFSHAPSNVAQIGKGRFALDQQLFLFNHASRTLDEFWCDARRGDPPFFAVATADLLASRNQNQQFPGLAMNLNGIHLGERLTAAKSASNDRSTLQPRPSKQFEDGTLLKFVAGKQVEFVLHRPPAVPAGILSAWSDHRTQTQSVPIDRTNADSLPILMNVSEDMPLDEASIATDVFFRGLRRSGEIVFKTLTGGKRTVFDLPEYLAPTTRVIRQQQEPERLLLVMDCSWSMRDSTNNGLSRLEVAQNAVVEFLDDLDRDVEVGLILFGDRYGFLQKRNPKNGKLTIYPVVENNVTKLPVIKFVNRQISDAGLIVADAPVPHNPNFDVRVGVPINPLDERQLKALKGQISNLGAIGTTPTYLAIQKAYEQLGRRSGHIIVLTDGKPKVISNQKISVEDSRQTALDTFTERKNDVRLTIVKYIDKDTQLRKDFLGADVLDAANGKDLLRHLQSVRSKPEVTWQLNREEASARTEFGSLVGISQWPPKGVGTTEGQPVLPAHRYSIRALVPDSNRPVDENADVLVEGGEQFEMLLSEGRLTHRPFNYEFSQLQPVNTQFADKDRFSVSCGPLSERRNRQLTMRIAIEAASAGKGNGKFTPRPSDIWIELTGIDSRRSNRQSKEVYSFSLPEFQVRQPIPILLSRIDGFEPRHDRIDVKAWFRFGERRIKGTSIPTNNADPYHASDIPGVSFRTQRALNAKGGIRLTVTEQYTDQRDPGTLRILPKPLPNRASTVLYKDKRVVVRTFDFDDPETSVTLSVCTSEELKSKSTLYADGVVELDFDSR